MTALVQSLDQDTLAGSGGQVLTPRSKTGIPARGKCPLHASGMLVSPRPGVDRDNLLKSLRSVYTDLCNLSGGRSARNAYERLLAYIEWASNAVRVLSYRVSSSDLNRLVPSERHRLLSTEVLGMTGTEQSVQRVLNGLISLEIDQRVATFEAAIRALESQIARWSGHGRYVMPDTSFYIQHKDKLEDVDLVSLTGSLHSDFVVFVPIVVVDELGRLKESKDSHVRWRAGYTLAVLDRLFADGVERAQLQKGSAEPGPDGLAKGEVGIELAFDPPGHVRPPMAGDEIIARALAIEPLADRKVTLLTYDSGQAMRARSAGLQVVKLNEGIGGEPGGMPTR